MDHLPNNHAFRYLTVKLRARRSVAAAPHVHIILQTEGAEVETTTPDVETGVPVSSWRLTKSR